jgi:hypothetical protein
MLDARFASSMELAALALYSASFVIGIDSRILHFALKFPPIVSKDVIASFVANPDDDALVPGTFNEISKRAGQLRLRSIPPKHSRSREFSSPRFDGPRERMLPASRPSGSVSSE